MKSFAFAAVLVAAVNAWSQPSYSYQPVRKATVSYVPEYEVEQGDKRQAASQEGYGAYQGRQNSDWDAWGRDQDLSIDESYGRTNAKSYRAESYDEWDNVDDDKYGAQAWGMDRDLYGASSWGKAASSQKVTPGEVSYDHYGKATYSPSLNWQGASASNQAAKAGYDNDVWAKQAYGSDYDSRWGKSYDSVDAKSYSNEHYAREVQADDDQWAEDYDSWGNRKKNAYGQAASEQGWTAGDDGYYGKGSPEGDYANASQAYGAGYWGEGDSDWDAWGRDQDYHEKTSYDQTWAKSYSAESYDEWDNNDNDRYGAQAWGKDRDAYGASSYGRDASEADYYGQAGYGKGGYGGQYGNQAADWEGDASRSAYDNDQWAKQAYGSDYDARWGKSYDRVSAKSYDNETYARWVQADDDQWAEDYDRWGSRDAQGYGKAASTWNNYGGAENDAASQAGYGGYWGKQSSDWDAWGRDQDLEIDESYENTWAKSYDAESYDEWDNNDNDRYGAQAWGMDRDLYGASSWGGKASAADVYGQGGYGKDAYGNQAASASYKAAQQGYDNDVWAKQAYGADYDSRWGKSYDSVDAKSYDNEQYARQVRADDDQWAEDYDRWYDRDVQGYGRAASAATQEPDEVSVSYKPQVSYSYGYEPTYRAPAKHEPQQQYYGW
jgi:hypothetical protein